MDVSGYLTLSAVEQTDARIARVFTPVKWGRRSYLIPPERFREFCDAVIDGDEPRREWAPGRFYASGPDDQAVGVPGLPEPWSTYLRERAALGTIVEVAEGGRAKVDVGSADGLRVDGVLTVQGRDGRFNRRKLRVVDLDEHACRAEQGEPGEFEDPLQVGWKVVAAREPLEDGRRPPHSGRNSRPSGVRLKRRARTALPPPSV
jgi:hypothetical protein